MTGTNPSRRSPPSAIESRKGGVGPEQTDEGGELLGPEFGATITGEGDVAPLRFREIMRDPGLSRLGVELWHKMRNPDSVDFRALEEAGLSIQELFGQDMAETDSASPEDELRRYRERLEIRADFLEALLDATLSELESLGPHVEAVGEQSADKVDSKDSTA